MPPSWNEIGRVVVGQQSIVEGTLQAILPAATCCWKGCRDLERRCWSARSARFWI